MSEELPSIRTYSVMRWPAGTSHLGPMPEGFIYADDDGGALEKLNATFRKKITEPGYKPGDVVEIKRPDTTILRTVSIHELLQ